VARFHSVSAAANPPVCAATAGKDTVIVGLVCPDAAAVDALAATLPPSSVLSPPARNDKFGLYNMMARDPAGYLVEIQAFLDPTFLKPALMHESLNVYEKHFSTLRSKI
jgi:hypothetical protein